jgi:hypothetical protein
MSHIIDQLKLRIIQGCHIFVVLFTLIVPFTGITGLLFLHSVAMPLLLSHWISNNNICSLTLIEKKIRKKIHKNEEVAIRECFTCKIIEPIYDFKKNNKSINHILYPVIIVVWVITVSKLFRKYKQGNIKSFYDLCEVNF